MIVFKCWSINDFCTIEVMLSDLICSVLCNDLYHISCVFSFCVCVCVARRRLWRTLCSRTRRPTSPSPCPASLIPSTWCSPWAAATHPPVTSWTASSRPSAGTYTTTHTPLQVPPPKALPALPHNSVSTRLKSCWFILQDISLATAVVKLLFYYFYTY